MILNKKLKMNLFNEISHRKRGQAVKYYHANFKFSEIALIKNSTKSIFFVINLKTYKPVK